MQTPLPICIGRAVFTCSSNMLCSLGEAPPGANMQIFISYKREEQNQVEQLVNILQDLELDVWYDVELAAGEDWEARLRQRSVSCSAMIVLWSKRAAHSDWVRIETEIGFQRGILVPAVLDSQPLPENWLGRHYAKLNDWVGNLDHPGIRQIVSGLEKQLGISLVPFLDERIGATNTRAVLALRKILIGIAKSGVGPLTYREAENLLATELRLTKPIAGRPFWGTLDALASQNRARREPPLPALVVSEGTGVPGKGYFQKHCFIEDHTSETAKLLHKEQVAKVRSYDWSEGVVD